MKPQCPSFQFYQNPDTKSGFNLVAVLLITLLSWIAYSNSLRNEFVWDDVLLIEENRYIRNWDKLKQIFTESLAAGAERGQADTHAFYRPLQEFSYLVDYRLWQLNPLGYHITNTLIHILSSCAVFWLVNILFSDGLLALISGLLFATHPIQTEAVAYISGRTDPLAALFMLLALILYVQAPGKNSCLLGGLSFSGFILALLSKETAVVFPLLLILYEYSFRRLDKPGLRRVFIFAAGALVFVALKLGVLAFTASSLRGNSLILYYRLNGFFKAIGSYARLLFIPVHQHMEYGMPVFTFLHPGVLPGLMLMAALIAAAIYLRKKSRLVFFAISWFFINLLVVSGIYPLNTYMAEHWLYLPSLGFFLLVAALFSSGIKKGKGLGVFSLFCLALLLSFYVLNTRMHSRYWKDAPTFFQRTLSYLPDKYKPEMYYNLANYYSKRKEFEQAVKMYEQALKFDPDYYRAYNNLGNLLSYNKDYLKAIAHYKKAISIKPDYLLAYKNLAYTYYAIGKYQQALNVLEQTLRIKADDLDIRFNIKMLRKLTK